MGTRASTDSADIRKLDDAELIARWAVARQQLALTVKGKTGHCEAKRRYDALASEYRRRLDGGLGA
jgi:hypothetical protein